MLDPVAVAEAALRLWARDGYAETGWRELADATGISARTLMRHFPSRADIAWLGVSDATARLRSALAGADSAQPLTSVVTAAVVQSVSHDALISRLTPDWLTVMQREPELIAAATAAHAAWIDTVGAYIADRAPGLPEPVCRAFAAAYHQVSFAALLAWAQSGAEGCPADAVERTLRWLTIDDPHTASSPATRGGTHEGRHDRPGPDGTGSARTDLST